MGQKNLNPVAIAIHGGAGTILKANMTQELEGQYHEALKASLVAGYNILKAHGSAIEAVQIAVAVMEDSPLFNAGKGSVFTHNKTHELDASIMEGGTLNAGAVSGVTRIKNPIKLAAQVLSNSEHVMLSGKGAEDFAAINNIEQVDPQYFYTERRWQQLQKILKEGASDFRLSEDASDDFLQDNHEQQHDKTVWPDDDKFGTVGAVAIDINGNLVAGTSTGGMTNKKFGRVGDSPIIGSGTYAENNTCAVSATGHGEFFMKAVVAYDIYARVKYKNCTLQQAADEVIQYKLKQIGGDGGVVAMASDGVPVFSFNSEGMYRGYINQVGEIYTAIF